MAKVLKKIRLVNPGRKRVRIKKRIRNSKRKLSAKQIKYFGTPAQKAALRRKRSGSRKISNPARKLRRRRKNPLKYVGKDTRYKAKVYKYKLENPVRRKRRTIKRRTAKRRLTNIGEIITVGLNPGRKKRSVSSMARRKRRSGAKRRVTRRRIGNPFFGLMRRKRRSNGRRRRSNPAKRRRSGIRNPGRSGVKDTGMKVLSLLGGAAVTKLISDRVPAQFTSGPIGYVVTAIVATIQGMLVGKALKKPEVGSSMMLGGYTYLGLKILAENFPGFAGYVPFGLSGGKGVGLLAPSSFYTPQVPNGSSVSNFVTPSAVNAIATQAGMKGIRTGRMR